MATLVSLQKQLKRFTLSKISREVLRIVKANEDVLIDANLQQLMEGEDSKGNKIDPPYASANYAEFKLTLNPAGVVDLNLTGAFHGGWRMLAGRWPVTFTSTDKKTSELKGKYGSEIFGVQQNNLGEINQKNILPDVQAYYKRDIFNLR